MKKIITLLLVTSVTFFVLQAQSSKELFMTKEIKKAYENGTRSYDGKPGKNYFQNRTDYKIKAEFNPETRIITGEEVITYQNNSKQDLSNLFIKLYQDLFKKGTARDWDLGSVDLHDGVEIKSVIIKDLQISRINGEN